MKQLEIEFQTNANGTGMQIFRQLKRGVTPTGKAVCLYQRIFAEGAREGVCFGYEVVIPSVKKAGTYPLPAGKTITYPEDFEEYPGASKFGFSAWSYPSYQPGAAEHRFKTLTEIPLETPEVEDEPNTDYIPGDVCRQTSAPKGRGRPKAERPPITIPEGEFSTREVADLNKVEYVTASQFLNEQEEAGLIRRTRTERRSARGKETQLFEKIQLTPAP